MNNLVTVLEKESSYRWELAAETIAVKIRWFGLLLGYALVNLGSVSGNRTALNSILAVGLFFTLIDTWFSWKGKIFLSGYPLIISFMESLFIGLLCYFDAGLNSTFRYYYILSLICCSIRYASRITYITCALHCLSYGILYWSLAGESTDPTGLGLMIVILLWVTWASNALATLLKRVGEKLVLLNRALQTNKIDLEQRIADRTRQLQEAQARLIQDERMAAFGLVAAGIAHEVGNPLTSISSMVQMLQKHQKDQYTLNKLSLVNGQLLRIRGILRELIEFSRPPSNSRSKVSISAVLEESLNIAKYYKRTGGRILTNPIPEDLPPIMGVHDQLVQVLLNLLLNAVDATPRNGTVTVEARKFSPATEESIRANDMVEILVRDTGSGIRPEDASMLFEPYFTTKKDGTGLGLFVCRKLVHEHQGTITFESTPGLGTVFQIRLPVNSSASDPLPTRVSPNTAPVSATVDEKYPLNGNLNHPEEQAWQLPSQSH